MSPEECFACGRRLVRPEEVFLTDELSDGRNYTVSVTTADPVVPEYSDAWLLGRGAEAGMTVAAIERALPGAMAIASAHLPAAADPVRAALADKAGEVTAIVSAARAALATPPKISPDRLPPKPAQSVSMADESFDIKSGPRRQATVVRAALAPQPVVQEQPTKDAP